MTLLRETINFLGWLFRVLSAFIRVRPLTTLAVVAMSAASPIFYLLAFLMPMKVLFLAGTSGVPGKLSFLVEPGQKMLWIYILAGASIFSYVAMIITDSLIDRLSSVGSEQLLNETETIPLFENQKTLAQSYYSSFSQIFGTGIFVGTVYLVGFFIYWQFFAFLVGSIIFCFLLYCLLLRSPEKSLPGTLTYSLRENYISYISFFSSLLFMGAFLFLLIPFLFYEESSILLAIVSFFILRRTISTIFWIFKNAIKLYSQKHRIDALIFPNVQLYEKQKTDDLAFFEFFSKDSRREHARDALERALTLQTDIDVLWEDSSIPGVNTFAIVTANSSSGKSQYFRQNVFPQKQTRKLENEEFLFSYIPRPHLKAPELITFYYVGNFQCQILDYGTGQQPENEQWQEIEDSLLEHVWSYRPPPDLERACCSSALMLYDRLDEELLYSVRIGADTEQEAQILNTFMQGLPAIRSRLQMLPMHIYNPDLKKDNVVLGKDGELYVMFWGRWSLEPVGVGVPPRLQKNGLSEMLEGVCQKRKDIPAGFSEEDIYLAANCRELENLVKRRNYKAALGLMSQMIESDAAGAFGSEEKKRGLIDSA